MLVRRLGVGALCFLASVSLVCDRVSSETGDKQLARVKGVVGYQESDTSAFKPIFGRLDLPDNSYAVTKANASAVLRLKDSSEIDIGENTKVQVGAFSPAESGNLNTIALNGGALHFNIRHPQGGQSNYRFVTATSQIAVRGTEGFLIAGANGTQVVCVSCAAGDVSVQVGSQTVSIVTNQTLTILGSNPLTATTSITANPTVNNPAINQFNGNQNPFSPTGNGTSIDPTGSASGAGTGAAGAGVSGVVTTVGAAAAAGAVAVAATSNKGGGGNSGGVGTLVLQLNFPGATTFPFPFSWPFSQQNATGAATFNCSPPNVITCQVVQSPITNGNLNGALQGTLNGPGAFSVGGSASGYTLPSTTFNVFGAVTLNSPAAPINFGFGSVSIPGSQNVTVSQAPAGTTLTASINCPGGSQAASVTLSGATGPSPLTFAVRANSAPNFPSGQAPATACTITVVGQGDGPRASLSIPVDVTATALNLQSHRRHTL
jgi:hypothetical protein